ncbi:MAG: GNAT family N-acetyltransferase [Lactobacillales bacterium]|jgi:ribosomal-protein-alanine N-acetyltransferase|nr:GNAT family N-acetyltransferase [Lactobacillales bacterium]
MNVDKNDLQTRLKLIRKGFREIGLIDGWMVYEPGPKDELVSKFPVEVATRIDGLKLRQYRLGDAAELTAMSERNAEFWGSGFQTQDMVERIKRAIISSAKNERADYAVEFEGVIVGAIGINFIHDYTKSASVGYSMDKAYTGRGFMSAALLAFDTVCFDAFGLHKINIETATDNEPSIAMLENCGYKYKGIDREMFYYDDKWNDYIEFTKINKNWKEEK